MTFPTRNLNLGSIKCDTNNSTVSTRTSTNVPNSLPAVLARNDLVLFGLLLVVALPNIEAMQFGGTSMLFYWALAFGLFAVPCTYVCCWLIRQAPADTPLFVWILQFMNERWRSFLLFLLWWSGVLGALSVMGLCLSMLQPLIPAGQNNLAVQSLLFAGVLALAILLNCLPLRLFRYILKAISLLYFAFFVLLISSAFLWIRAGHSTPGIVSHVISSRLPGTFSWPIFGLAILSLLGLHFLFLLDGEMRGSQRFLRHSTGYLWWSSGLILFALVTSTIALLLVEPTALAAQHNAPIRVISMILGPGAGLITQYLLAISNFGIVLIFFLLLSRGLLIGARLGYVPRSFSQLTRAGVPIRAILIQSALTVGGALALLVIAPNLLKTFAPPLLSATLLTDNQFCLVSSVANILWALFTALIFAFAFWFYLKKRRNGSMRWHECVCVPALCLCGFLTSLICAVTPLTPGWPDLFLSSRHWFPQAVLGLACSLLLAWLVSESPRRSALLREQHHLLAREKSLRWELQQTYARECNLHTRLREAYDELNYLYQKQERAATTDCVTGLPNHRACIQRLDEEIARCQSELTSCLVFFVDLDHFKVINDTWGHLAGDTILRQVAQRLNESLRPGDFVGRYGGEEFALLLACTTLFDAQAEAARLHQIIHATPYEWRGAREEQITIPVTASIGIAAYGVHGTQREELIQQADRAMYEAKLDGRNCVRIADVQAPIAQEMSPPIPNSTLHKHRQSEGSARDDARELLISAQALQALVAVVRAHDHFTHIHSHRLLQLAEETGRRLGVSDDDLFLMRLGGLLHDIGKIGIPEAILNKPGPLNEQEWEIMHRHPEIGARILQEIGGGFQLLVPLVLAHHERWDGRGYPRGLKGQEIPLPARVLSVVDAYDTMISHRPYKEPVPGAMARAELQRCAGTQFDPAVTNTFLSFLESIALDKRYNQFAKKMNIA